MNIIEKEFLSSIETVEKLNNVKITDLDYFSIKGKTNNNKKFTLMLGMSQELRFKYTLFSEDVDFSDVELDRFRNLIMHFLTIQYYEAKNKDVLKDLTHIIKREYVKEGV